MIHCSVHDEDDATIFDFWAKDCPRAGEILWRTDSGDVSAFRITEVCHWVHSDWSPGTHTGDPLHNVCLYVEPVKSTSEAGG